MHASDVVCHYSDMTIAIHIVQQIDMHNTLCNASKRVESKALTSAGIAVQNSSVCIHFEHMCNKNRYIRMCHHLSYIHAKPHYHIEVKAVCQHYGNLSILLMEHMMRTYNMHVHVCP